MKQYFLPQPLAQKAKELGFREKCIRAIELSNNHSLNYTILNAGDFNSATELISIPLYTQITDWFEKEHNLIIMPELHMHLANFKGATKTWFVAQVWPDGTCTKLAHVCDTQDAAIEYAFRVIEANKQ